MFNIGDFLKRATNKQSKELYFRKIVQDVVKEHVGIEVPLSKIFLKAFVLNFKNISSGERSAIFIKREKLLAEINNLQNTYKVEDIR